MALHDSLEEQPPHKRSRHPGVLLDHFENPFGPNNAVVQPNQSIIGNAGSASAVIEASHESSMQSRDSFHQGMVVRDELITSPNSMPMPSPQNSVIDPNSCPAAARPASISNRSASSSVSGLLSPFDRCLGPVSEETRFSPPRNALGPASHSDQIIDASARCSNHAPFTNYALTRQFNSPLDDFEMFQGSPGVNCQAVSGGGQADQSALQVLRQTLMNSNALPPSLAPMRALRPPGQKPPSKTARATRGRPPSKGRGGSRQRQSLASPQRMQLNSATMGSSVSPEQFAASINEERARPIIAGPQPRQVVGYPQGAQQYAGQMNGAIGSDIQMSPYSSSPAQMARQMFCVDMQSRGKGQTPSAHEASRIRLLTAQMVLLLHAHQCSQRDRLSARIVASRPSGSALPSPCQVQQCTAMKCILNHALKCQRGDVCEVQHCSSSRKLIKHWRSCVQSECPICSPIRTSSNLHCTVDPAPLTTTRSCQEWQKCMSPDVRSNLITKIISSILPPHDNGYLRDKRMLTFVNFIRKLEAEVFDASTDQDMYFYRLAEKAFRIRMDIETSRRQKPDLGVRHRDKQLSVDEGSLSVCQSGSFFSRIPYNPDAMAGEKGPPNTIAPSALGHQLNRHASQLRTTKLEEEEGGQWTLQAKTQDSMDFGRDDNDTVREQKSSESMVNDTESPRRDVNSLECRAVKTEGHSCEDMGLEEAQTSGRIEEPGVKAESEVKEEKMEDSVEQERLREMHKHRIEVKERINSEVLHEIFMSDDSIPFRQPVDPVLLNIPDYFDIIQRPMDLSTIKKKLDDLEYESPWDLIDDMWLMFQNAWTYNKKTSKIFKMCSRLCETFVQLMNTAMVELGYCCGQKHVFLPQVMFCYGNQLCAQIARDSQYHCYVNKNTCLPNLTNDRYTFCLKCFESSKDDVVMVGDDPNGQMHAIAKSEFEVLKNDRQEYELLVPCKLCGRKWHQVCGLYHESICTDSFICPRCEAEKSVKCKRNRLTASKLSNNKLGNWIENRVNNFLSKAGASAVVGKIHIRVLASFDKSCETKPRIKQFYNGKIPDKFPFRSKAIFAFQEIDGQDVAFFGLHVQEYDAKAPQPNTRRVYISYLDSVYFFQPKQLRTDVYHEILIGYLDWAKRMGYQWGHIWACPPSEGDDYIFYCHPSDQKVPKQKRLIEWYRRMLDKALLDRVVISYQDIMKDVLEQDIKALNDIPYFDGDFWPNVFEESIKEMEEDGGKGANEGTLSDNCDVNDDNSQSSTLCERTEEDEPMLLNPAGDGLTSKRCSQKKKKQISKQNSQRKLAAKKVFAGCDLTSKVFATMDKHKEVFFVIRLSEALTSSTSTDDIVDADPVLTSELMDGRDAFLNFARERHLEFSSLRRAKYSTMLFLFEIHSQGADRFVYTCNRCKTQVDTRFHCTVCEDFDLCVGCYQTAGHEHPMDRVSSGALDIVGGQKLTSESSASKSGYAATGGGQESPTGQHSRQQTIERCIEILLHAVNCRNANCSSHYGCQKMKLVVQHIRQCSKASGTCQICRQINLLCHPHARVCTDPNCQFPFCAGLKQKMQKQRALNSQLERRRMMTTMQRNIQSTSAAVTPLHHHHHHPQMVTSSPSAYPSLGKGHIRMPQQTDGLLQQLTAYRTVLGQARQPLTAAGPQPVQQSGQQYAVRAMHPLKGAGEEYVVWRGKECHRGVMQPAPVSSSVVTNHARQMVIGDGHFVRQDGRTVLMMPSFLAANGRAADEQRYGGMGMWYPQEPFQTSAEPGTSYTEMDSNGTDMAFQQRYTSGEYTLMDVGQAQHTGYGPMMTSGQSQLYGALQGNKSGKGGNFPPGSSPR